MVKTTLVQIGDCANIVNGFAFKSELFTTERKGLPVVRIRDVVRGRTETYYTGEHPDSAVIRNGDLLVGMDGEFNIARWQGGTALLNQRVCKIEAKAGVSDIAYLRHALCAVLKRVEHRTPFVTVKHLSSDELKEETVLLPELLQQQRIAEQLEQADRLRRIRRYTLELTDTFLPAAFLELFRGQNPAVNPWPAASLGEHLEAIEGGVNFNPVGENDPASDWRVLKVSAVSWSDFLAEESKPISPAESFSEKLIVQRGDLIMSRANTVELVGAVVRVRRPPPKVLLPDKLWRLKLRAASQLLPDFLLYALRSSVVRREIQIRASGTSGSMKNISKEDVRELRLPLPPFQLQQKFAALVEQVEHLRAVQGEALRQAEHFFQTLLHRAFSETNSTGSQGRSSCMTQEVT